jgi:hypothetical protein
MRLRDGDAAVMLTSVVSRGCARRSRDPLHGISTATPASASRSDGLVGRVVTEGGRPRSPAPDRRGSHRWTEMGRGGPCSSPDLNDPATSPPCTSNRRQRGSHSEASSGAALPELTRISEIHRSSVLPGLVKISSPDSLTIPCRVPCHRDAVQSAIRSLPHPPELAPGPP